MLNKVQRMGISTGNEVVIRRAGIDVSERIDALKFPLIVIVVYVHSKGILELTGQSVNKWFIFTVEFVSNGIGCSAVPLFLIISGYLYYSNYHCNIRGYLEKMKSRLRSLLVPYVFWISLIVFTRLLIQSISAFHFFRGRSDLIADYGWFDFVNAFIGLNGYPALSQFWFMRELILACLFSPFFYWLAMNLPRMGFALLSLLWVCQDFFGPFLFFYTGCFLVLKDWDILKIDSRRAAFLIAFFFGALFYTMVKIYFPNELFLKYAGKVLAVMGVLSVWGLSGFLKQRFGTILTALAGLVFFCLCFTRADQPLYPKGDFALFSLVY